MSKNTLLKKWDGSRMVEVHPVTKASNVIMQSTDSVEEALAKKVDKVAGKGLSTEDYTTTEKTKLGGIAAGANNYVHPTGDGNYHLPAYGSAVATSYLKAGKSAGSMFWAQIPAMDIVTDPSSRFVSDSEKTGWNAKADVGTTVGKVPALDAGGKLDASVLPAIAISDTFEVASQAAMLALTAQRGDVAVRTDLTKTFILAAEPASTLANWKELLNPLSPVQSVAGKTGAVTLGKGDVGLGNVDNVQQAPISHVGAGGSAHAAVTTSAAGFMSAADKTKLDGVANGANAYVHPSGDGNQHIPATGTGNNGKVLKSGATAGSAAWSTLTKSDISDFPSSLPANGGNADTVDGFHVNDLITPFASTYGGSSTNLSADFTPAFTKVTGRAVRIRSAYTTVGSPTLNADGTGATPIRNPNGSPAKLKEWGVYTLVYDASNEAFILQGEGGDNSLAEGRPGIKWTGRTSPITPNEMVYGVVVATNQPRFVSFPTIVSSTTTYMTSDDGLTWTSRTSSAFSGVELNSIAYGLAYGNGLYVLITNPGSGSTLIFTSPDAITWTYRQTVATAMREITYVGGLFVSVGGGTTSCLVTSTNGTSWTLRSMPVAVYEGSIAYGNGKFVLIGKKTPGLEFTLLTSPDGITWTEQPASGLSEGTGNFVVSYGNGMYLAVCSGGLGNRVFKSIDGVTWVPCVIPGLPAAKSFRNICFGAGLFVLAAASNMYVTPDGVNFTDVEIPMTNVYGAIDYGNDVFVITGPSGTYKIATSGIPRK